MKNDLVFKILVSFLFPLLLTYSLTSLLYSYLYDSVTIIMGFLIIVIISLIYQLKFRRISILNVYASVKLKSIMLVIIFGYFLTLLIINIGQQ